MRIEYNALLKRNSNLKSDIVIAPYQTKGGSMGVVGICDASRGNDDRSAANW